MQTTTEEHFGPQVDPCYTARVFGDNWLDQVHGYVQDNTCEPAVWFDTFFVKNHVLLAPRPGVIIIFRNSAWWPEGDSASYIHDFHVEWELPQWEKLMRKWRILIESRTSANRYTAQPGQPVEPGVNRTTGVRRPIIGLQADLFSWLRSLATLDTGVNIGIHPDAHVRMRYQYVRPFRELYVARFSEIAMWQAVEHFTNTMQFDIERKITTFTLLRWGNNLTYLEGTPGLAWSSGVSLLTQLSLRSAISYDVAMWGSNYPDWDIKNYRVGSLYRRNFYRPWLFFELAPEVTWPRDEESNRRKHVYAMMFTLEMQFGK